jgi:hypothetical protein
MSENQTEFKGFARVEVMGHQTHIGYVETQAFGGTVLFRVDQPALPEEEEELKFPRYIDGSGYVEAGTIVKHGALPAVSVLVGAGSIYRIIPCDEEAAKVAIRQSVRRPLSIVRLAGSKALADGRGVAIVDECDEGDGDHDDYMPGGF